jgi:lipopolysaccharide export system permease protein
MTTLHRYILRSLLVALGLSVVVFFTVLLLGNAFRIVSRFTGLLSPPILGRIFVYLTPSLLSYSLPFGVLVAVLLVFGKLSANNEITAMRANGINILQTLAPVLALGAGISAICIPINTVVGPEGKWALRQLPSEIPVQNPLVFLQPGVFSDVFKDLLIYVQKIDGNRVERVIVYELDPDTRHVLRKVEAEEGTIVYDAEAQALDVELLRAQIETADPEAPEDPTRIRSGLDAARYPVRIPLGQYLERMRERRKMSDRTIFELASEIRELGARQADASRGMDYAALERQMTPLLIEAHKRVALALAPLAFALIGMPLGIQTSRRETMVGIGIGLLIALAYYVVIGIAEGLRTRPELHPELILWVPNIVCEVLGIGLLLRLSRF